ncbi:hypothetical protein B0H13DRAFT_2524193 [Mycena leptocephala]|nr:hypothetical protein B0H13DRAFT_2524193 [Mycena leptocephala]
MKAEIVLREATRATAVDASWTADGAVRDASSQCTHTLGCGRVLVEASHRPSLPQTRHLSTQHTSDASSFRPTVILGRVIARSDLNIRVQHEPYHARFILRRSNSNVHSQASAPFSAVHSLFPFSSRCRTTVNKETKTNVACVPSVLSVLSEPNMRVLRAEYVFASDWADATCASRTLASVLARSSADATPCHLLSCNHSLR